jgi:hypothetical protein
MATRTKKKHWIPSELPAKNPLGELQFVVLALNGVMLYATEYEDSARHQELLRHAPVILRGLVAAWRESGPNLARFMRDWPTHSQNISRMLEANPIQFAWGNLGGCLFVKTFIDRLATTPRLEAYRWFCLLITNPFWDRLAGPCVRCGRYYARRAVRKRIYCSRSCGSKTTALLATAKLRERQHAEKVQRAQAAVQRWKCAATKLDWKTWVSRNEKDISVSFLTRSVNRGEIVAPSR